MADRSDIATLRWTRSASGDVWIIASPLGNEVARIESSTHGARLSQAGGESQEAPSFQALTQHVLGVALDPQLLARWLHGEIPRDAGGWNVTIDETQRAGAIDLAKRITASRDEVRVRLVIDGYRALQR